MPLLHVIIPFCLLRRDEPFVTLLHTYHF